ncbi:SPOR domain-containing protein [Azospirillum soli]|uniref:SPOR domain-containing protein n=1 Tax=Azospirillum soli TaxID=1304799 RepID=UPI001AE51608|nr:SPOR domain-containing protein [Azospirillum soli]MBP2315881.1 hypothetical protein [Azospirillum soli]
MRTKVMIGLTALGTLMLGGCAGVPVAVTAASLYVDSILYLRTNKTSTDHIVSAAMDRDCAVLNIFTEGALCKDAPPPPLIVAVMREVQNVPLDQPATVEAKAPSRTGNRIEVAEAPVTLLSDAVPAEGAAPLPPRKPQAAVTVTAPVPQGIIAEAAIRRVDRQFLVVVGSFAKRDQAEAHRDRLGRADATIAEATVRGRLYHRVVLPPGDRTDALRQVAEARAAGVRDAWLLPWSGKLDVDTAVAALPYVGFLYRM